MTLVAVENLQKSYPSSGGGTEMIVNVPSFNMGEQDQLAMQGSSGSGKTTFLHLLAGVLLPDSGHISFSGQGLHLMNESQRDQLRLNQIGYVFQSFNLLNGFSCLENLLLTMELKGKPDPKHAESLLQAVGLSNRIDYLPHQLSIGQQQRVAVARALVNRPKLVLADEPTGNLDPENTDRSLQLLRSLCEEWGSALVLVSHDPRVIAQFGKQIDWEEINQVKRTGSDLNSMLERVEEV
jgi:ABC-type lipoprotein export system ATPase subunit